MELRQLNSLQRATIEATADGIVVTDRDDVIRAYQPEAAWILNIPVQPPRISERLGRSHLGVSFRSRGGGPLITIVPDSAEKIVTTDMKFASGRIYELYVHPQKIGDRIVGRVWSLHDVTDQRLAEDAHQNGEQQDGHACRGSQP